MNKFINSKAMLYILTFGVLLLSLTPHMAYAAENTLATIFQNGEDAWKSITILMGAAMFVTGVVLGGIAITKFKDVSNGKATTTQPIILTIISASLIASPSVIMTITETYYNEKIAFTPTQLLSSIPDASFANGMSGALSSVLIFVQMLGIIAFFRGIVLLRAIGSGKEAPVGKAFIHIFGGALAINIQPTIGVLARTFFFSGTMPIGMENW